MKTSRIKTIQSIKPYQHSRGTTYYHNLEMENGDKINIGKNKEQQIGAELTYEISGNVGEREYTKAKAAMPIQAAPATKDDLILRQVAFKGVIELISSGKLELHEVDEFTDKFFNTLKK